MLNRIPTQQRAGALRAFDVVVAALNAQIEEDSASAESGEDRT